MKKWEFLAEQFSKLPVELIGPATMLLITLVALPVVSSHADRAVKKWPPKSPPEWIRLVVLLLPALLLIFLALAATILAGASILLDVWAAIAATSDPHESRP